MTSAPEQPEFIGASMVAGTITQVSTRVICNSEHSELESLQDAARKDQFCEPDASRGPNPEHGVSIDPIEISSIEDVV